VVPEKEKNRDTLGRMQDEDREKVRKGTGGDKGL